VGAKGAPGMKKSLENEQSCEAISASTTAVTNRRYDKNKSAEKNKLK
jgi:hypothetical protein